MTPYVSPDGWVELRDEKGTLWAEYHPGKRLLKRQKKLYGALHVALIPLDSLTDGTYRVDLRVEDLPR